MATPQSKYIELASTLVVLALCAFLLAKGTVALAADAVFGDLEAEADAGYVSPSIRRSALGSDAPSRDADPILKRNIFDSQTGPLDGSALDPSIPEDASPSYNAVIDPNNPPGACSSGPKLVGLVYWGKQGESSLVALRSGESVKTFRVGDSVDGSEVALVRQDWVALRQSSGPCSLRMFGEGPALAEEAPRPNLAARVVTKSDSAGGISSDEYDKNIQKISDTKYNVRRQLVDKLLTNRAEMMRTARVVPFEENGRVVGVKMYGIRASSLLGKIGMQNGDMLKTINGFDMTTPDGALEAYAKLRNAEQLTITLERGGSPLTMDYTIN